MGYMVPVYRQLQVHIIGLRQEAKKVEVVKNEINTICYGNKNIPHA